MERKNKDDAVNGLKRMIRSHPAIIPFIRYGVVGVGCLIIYVGSASLLHRFLSLDAVFANSTGYLIATVGNYLANFYWSFSSEAPHSRALVRYLLIVASGIALNALYAATLTKVGAPVEVIAASFALLWPVISFTSMRLWAFRK